MKHIFFVLLLSWSALVYSQDIDSLKIGSGGGITGSVTVFKFENTRMLKGKGMVSIKYNESAPVKCKKRKKLLKNAKSLLREGAELNSPGNTYQFIEIYAKGKILKMVWHQSEIPAATLQYIENIKEIIKNLKFSQYEK